MEKQMDLTRLSDFFAHEDIEWKPITISKRTSKGLAAAYITARAIMDRLDAVCGPANWRNEFRPGPDGGVLCGISIRVPQPDGSVEWVTKWDGAENTDIEAVKGGLSSAMRRAAVQWGIGRYLYDLPQQWVPVDERGRFAQTPGIPSVFLPPTGGDGAATREASAPTPAQPSSKRRPATAAGGRQETRQETRQEARPQRAAPTQPGPAAPPRNAPTKNDDAFFMPQDLPF